MKLSRIRQNLPYCVALSSFNVKFSYCFVLIRLSLDPTSMTTLIGLRYLNALHWSKYWKCLRVVQCNAMAHNFTMQCSLENCDSLNLCSALFNKTCICIR